MADGTKIEWCDATWQIVTGCSIVSPGCTNCYAMRLAGTRLKDHPSRKGLTKIVNGNHVWTGEVRFNKQWLTQPLRWKRPRRIFVAAHGDLFHESVPDGWIMRVLWVMGHAQHHTFQVLTKRSKRMREFFAKWCDVNQEQDLDFKNARGPAEVRAVHKSGRGRLFADMLEAMGKPPPGAAYPMFDWAGGMARWPRGRLDRPEAQIFQAPFDPDLKRVLHPGGIIRLTQSTSQWDVSDIARLANRKIPTIYRIHGNGTPGKPARIAGCLRRGEEMQRGDRRPSGGGRLAFFRAPQ